MLGDYLKFNAGKVDWAAAPAKAKKQSDSTSREPARVTVHGQSPQLDQQVGYDPYNHTVDSRSAVNHREEVADMRQRELLAKLLPE